MNVSARGDVWIISNDSLASNKFELINTPKPSTDTAHFRAVESLEIPGSEDESENTHLKLHLGQHSILRLQPPPSLPGL